MYFQLDCPDCGQAELEPFGGKWRCVRCHFILSCCETDCDAEGRP